MSTRSYKTSNDMLKICNAPIYKPVESILSQCLLASIFQLEWKTGNVVPIHKKTARQCVNNKPPSSIFIISEAQKQSSKDEIKTLI